MGCCMTSNESNNGQQDQSNRQPNIPPGGGQVQQRHPGNRPRGSRPSQGSGIGGAGGSQTGLRIQYLQNHNVERILQNQTTGEGIKKTPSYETPLSKHALQKWREEFWETRTSGQQEIWQLLRNACQEDNDTASALIMAADLNMPQNSLTTCIDQAGVYYRVPIACINDPVNYEQNYQYQKLKDKVKPASADVKDVKIKLFPDKFVTTNVPNHISIKELKQLYVQKLQEQEIKTDGMEPESLRFFCVGKELQDDLYVYSYDLKDEITIQCMKRATPAATDDKEDQKDK